MNKPFTGFSTDKQRTVRVPEGFFEDVLPQIGSMLEMKVTLYLFWRLARMVRGGRDGSVPRMVSLDELEDETFSFERERSLGALRELSDQIQKNRPLSELEQLEKQLGRAIERQEFERGKRMTEVVEVGPGEGTGTSTTFLADSTIFSDSSYDFDTLSQRFREMAYLTKGLTITLVDERPGVGDEREDGRSGVGFAEAAQRGDRGGADARRAVG